MLEETEAGAEAFAEEDSYEYWNLEAVFKF